MEFKLNEILTKFEMVLYKALCYRLSELQRGTINIKYSAGGLS